MKNVAMKRLMIGVALLMAVPAYADRSDYAEFERVCEHQGGDFAYRPHAGICRLAVRGNLGLEGSVMERLTEPCRELHAHHLGIERIIPHPSARGFFGSGDLLQVSFACTPF